MRGRRRLSERQKWHRNQRVRTGQWQEQPSPMHCNLLPRFHLLSARCMPLLRCLVCTSLRPLCCAVANFESGRKCPSAAAGAQQGAFPLPSDRRAPSPSILPVVVRACGVCRPSALCSALCGWAERAVDRPAEPSRAEQSRAGKRGEKGKSRADAGDTRREPLSARRDLGRAAAGRTGGTETATGARCGQCTQPQQSTWARGNE
jgi:hypothetical protein